MPNSREQSSDETGGCAQIGPACVARRALRAAVCKSKGPGGEVVVCNAVCGAVQVRCRRGAARCRRGAGAVRRGARLLSLGEHQVAVQEEGGRERERGRH